MKNPKIVKNSKKILKSEKISKNHYLFFSFFFLDFQYEEDAIRPELSSPARFRFQVGVP